MLKTRILTALVLVPLVLVALFALPPRGWGVAMLVVVVVAATEWARLAGLSRAATLMFAAATLLAGAALLFLPASTFERGWPRATVSLICGAATAFWLLVAPLWLGLRWRVESKLLVALSGGLVLIAAWVAVVQLQARSPSLLLALLAVVWIADTAAYFTGKRFGRRKLAPSISPGKTWAGVYGALAATAVYALLLLPLAAEAGYTTVLSAGAVGLWLMLIMLLTILSVVGDLYESQLKRQRGVKDSGALLPGHGGALDRIDGLLAAMPAAALISLYFIH